MKKIASLICVLAMVLTSLAVLASCGSSKEKIVIWTSGEDFRNNYYLTELQKKFPQYEIKLDFVNSSTIANKVYEEGDSCAADIILSEEYNYLYKCEEYLAELNDFDYSVFLDDMIPTVKKFTPETRESGCIIVNTKVLEQKGLPEPTCYEDLADPKYEGLVSMASPRSSGTAYMFVRQLTNEWGEDEAFAYFDRLAKNINQFPASGSGPVNALIKREAAIGIGMTLQAIYKINEGNDELKTIYFEEGSPYSRYGNAVLRKSAGRQAVMDVFNYLATDLCKGDNEYFVPDQIYKDFKPVIKGFPEDVKYGDMSNDTQAEKERLLDKWKY